MSEYENAVRALGAAICGMSLRFDGKTVAQARGSKIPTQGFGSEIIEIVHFELDRFKRLNPRTTDSEPK